MTNYKVPIPVDVGINFVISYLLFGYLLFFSLKEFD